MEKSPAGLLRDVVAGLDMDRRLDLQALRKYPGCAASDVKDEMVLIKICICRILGHMSFRNAFLAQVNKRISKFMSGGQLSLSSARCLNIPRFSDRRQSSKSSTFKNEASTFEHIGQCSYLILFFFYYYYYYCFTVQG